MRNITPHIFSDVKNSNILQAIDLICYALRQRRYNLERGEIKDFWTGTDKDDLLQTYWKLFISGTKGQVSGYGLKVWY